MEPAIPEENEKVHYYEQEKYIRDVSLRWKVMWLWRTIEAWVRPQVSHSLLIALPEVCVSTRLANRKGCDTIMATTRPTEVRPPHLPAGIIAVGPQFPLSTGYYWIGQATTRPQAKSMAGIVIYNDDECYFLYAQDALSILYFLRSLEDTLLQQTGIAFHFHQDIQPFNEQES